MKKSNRSSLLPLIHRDATEVLGELVSVCAALLRSIHEKTKEDGLALRDQIPECEKVVRMSTAVVRLVFGIHTKAGVEIDDDQYNTFLSALLSDIPKEDD